MRSILAGLVTLLVVTFSNPVGSHAFEISVDASDYRGSYSIIDLARKKRIGNRPESGEQISRFTLGRPGEYQVYIRPGVGINFTFDGQEVGCLNANGIKCTNSNIRFETVSIRISPLWYRGNYRLFGSVPGNSPKKAKLLPVGPIDDAQTGYLVNIGAANLRFFVGKHGKIIRNRHYRSSTWAFSNILFLRSVPLLIKPVGHSDGWKIRESEWHHQPGKRIVWLFPGNHGVYEIIPEGSNSCSLKSCKFALDRYGRPDKSVLAVRDKAGKVLRFKISRFGLP